MKFFESAAAGIKLGLTWREQSKGLGLFVPSMCLALILGFEFWNSAFFILFVAALNGAIEKTWPERP